MFDWHPDGYEAFFQTVLREEELKATMRRLDLNIGETSSTAGMHNAGLQVAKSTWTLPMYPGEEKTVTIHYELRRRGILRLDAEICPYEVSTPV